MDTGLAALISINTPMVQTLKDKKGNKHCYHQYTSLPSF